MHLYLKLIKSTKEFGYKKNTVEDSFGNSISNFGLIFKSILLSKRLYTGNDTRVGLMLPNSVPTTVTFFSLLYLNKTTAIINFTSGLKNILSCIDSAEITHVITSKKFIDQINMNNDIDLIKKKCKVIYLEDAKNYISFGDKLKTIKEFIMEVIINDTDMLSPDSRFATSPSNIFLFTSGTESKPKAVYLNSDNLLANEEQVLDVLKIEQEEIFFTCLPFFHSFGLGIGILLPIFTGCKLFLYPTPLNYKIIPELIEKSKATVFFSTDTFLKKYIKYSTKSTFKNIKYLIAGAEKLDLTTYDYYKNNFNVQILEGYGVTEASPAVSVNTHENYRIGSVGKILPRIEYKLEGIEGYDKGGLLYLKGRNIMDGGYYDKGKFSGKEEGGWYNTGDVAYVDEDGYLFILGRLKRFAKIAGEMISLIQVEEYPKKLWPENNSVVCSIKDSNKGEALILLTDNKNADLETLINSMKETGLSSLYAPRKIKIIDEFPILGSGKLDFKKLQDIAEN